MLRVLLFASLRDRAGWGERTLQLGSDAVSAAQLWSQLELGSMQGISVAVNQELVGADQLLKPGDELAFLPPFTGG
ncbi:MoaD/ThiS family protein [Parasynechococcus sp.]|jgi:molybdopterin synthase sulfur carrier subunit|uniref:MoaD/ThiS family protein n=1 Tax=Parasynechococcus sp. TaxID=3101203 RepID=UPI003703F021